MFESPIYIDFPWSIGIFCTVCAVAMFYGLVVFKRRQRFHALVMWYVRRRSGGLPDERLEVMSKVYFVGMTLLFGAMGLFCLAIGSGILRNKPWTDEDRRRAIQKFEEEHRHLPRRKIVIPGREDAEESKEKRS